MKSLKKIKYTKVIGIILFVSLFFSLGYAIIKFIAAPVSVPDSEPYQKLKSDYLLMITQCTLGILVMALPSFIAKKFKVIVPNAIVVIYYIFLYCAIYLGEIKNFYYHIPYWDAMLHFFSGAMLGALGFILVDLLNRDTNVKVDLSPFFVALFAFSFALAISVIWEIYEFAFDDFLGLNMQKFRTESGTPLPGREALSDTMEDMYLATLAALIPSTLGYISAKLEILKSKKTNKEEISEITEASDNNITESLTENDGEKIAVTR